jgi:retron-type reverse transcriptase
LHIEGKISNCQLLISNENLNQDIFERIISLDNLIGAWGEFSRGKRKKRDVQQFEFALEDNLLLLAEQLRSGEYQIEPYTSFYVCDPKLRHIHKASVRDRVLFQAVYRVINPLFEKQFIYDSFSSRVGKGTHAGVARLEQFLIEESANASRPARALKCDVARFFDSIDHEILFELLGWRIADEKCLELLRLIIDSFWIATARTPRNDNGRDKEWKRGLPLGNVTSQLFANVYLHELDFFVKQQLRVKKYARYCDDFVIVGCSSEEVEELIEPIRIFLMERLRLTLHPRKISIRTYQQGVDFLGYVLRPHHRLLRTKTKQRLLRRIDEKNRSSYVGMLAHCAGYRLYKRVETHDRHPRQHPLPA